MIGLEDRQALARDIHAAHTAGARLHLACETAGIELRTLQRWKAQTGLVRGDGRPQAARPRPAHALSPAERAEVLRVANEARFAEAPPARIVPVLADKGIYLASESTFARVLRGLWADDPPWTHQGTTAGTPAHHARGQRAGPGVVLGHDLLACAGDGALVLPLPDPGLV